MPIFCRIISRQLYYSYWEKWNVSSTTQETKTTITAIIRWVVRKGQFLKASLQRWALYILLCYFRAQICVWLTMKSYSWGQWKWFYLYNRYWHIQWTDDRTKSIRMEFHNKSTLIIKFLFHRSGKGTQKKKTPWQQTEVQAVEKHMRRFITSCIVPNKSDCQKCLKAEPEALKSRDWQNLKFYVYNRITAYKRKLQCA